MGVAVGADLEPGHLPRAQMRRHYDEEIGDGVGRAIRDDAGHEHRAQREGASEAECLTADPQFSLAL